MRFQLKKEGKGVGIVEKVPGEEERRGGKTRPLTGLAGGLSAVSLAVPQRPLLHKYMCPNRLLAVEHF